jgi:hypothetical protein
MPGLPPEELFLSNVTMGDSPPIEMFGFAFVVEY